VPATGERQGPRLEFAHLIFLGLSGKPLDLVFHQLLILF
jgi:hypothetical protein